MGEELTKRCSFGMTVVKCNEVGHWELVRDDCACAADDIWPQTELNTRVEVTCANRGKLTRECLSTGVWGEVQNFNCKCPAEGVWSETPAGSYARAGCGSGFVRRLCGTDGQWTEIYDRSACYCSPQSGWQRTLSGETATKACPAGEMTRECDEQGAWKEIDYSNCMCKALDGFDATPVNTVATAPCFDADGVPDPENTQTRFCGPDGEWGAVDQNQCPVKWCPSEQSWYKVPVGTRPTTVTIGCMHGERSRVCNVNGVWGPVNNENCRCTYTEDEQEVLLPPGESYGKACSVGERVYTCNADSGYFDPVDLSECKCGREGPFATTLAGDIASSSCSEGTMTRVCGLDGFWEERDVSNCFCGSEGIWRQSSPGEVVSILCDVGFRSRTCADNGMWEAPIQDLCKCAGEFDLSFGEQHTEACDVGSIVYGCQEDGHMAEPDVSACFCEARDEFGRFWNQRRAGEESPAMTCMNGVSVTRTCGALTGHWEDLDASACRCEAEDEWSETGVGEWSEAPCVGGSKGMRRRQCYGYRWGEVDESRCEQPCAYNHGNGTVTKVPVGETLSVACYVNMDGAMTYECVYNEETMRSELHLKESTCTRLACTNDDGTLVNVGETESRSCGDGFMGEKTRTCQQGALWSDYDMSKCRPIICRATTVDGKAFSATLANTNATAPCPEGYNGNLLLYCDIRGVWATSIVDACVRNVCAAEGAWGETLAGEGFTLPCPADYTGMWTRHCLLSGEWEPEVIPETCIPIPPTVKTMPYEGMTHVSRRPSAALFSTLAIKTPLPDCEVEVVSTSDASDRYRLRVNATKTSLVGRHRNGGVFADFIPKNEDAHDIANYLRYGEYKMVFPACWRALNDAVVPETPLGVTFTTAPLPPSAPRNVEVVPGSDSFTVRFDAPEVVDAPYPVTAYYLAFQPPLLPEVRVDSTARSFGPFAYLPGHVSLLLRAENAYGLSSPDMETPYDFDDLLAEERLRIQPAAPELAVVSQVAEGNAVAVTVSVAVPVSLHAFASYLEVTCNGEAVAAATTLSPTLYTAVSEAESSLTITCYFTLGETSGTPASLTVTSVASELPYGAVEVTAEEKEAQLLRVQWTPAAVFATTPVSVYVVQCKRPSDAVFGVTRFVTALEALIPVSEFAPGPVECRVAAAAEQTVPEQAAWSSVTVETLHSVEASEVTITTEAHATHVTVQVASPFCLDATARLTGAEGMEVSLSLVCGEEGMSAVFAGLRPESEYALVVKVPRVEVEKRLTVTTLAQEETSMTMELREGSVTGSSAVLDVTTSVVDAVYCVAAKSLVAPEELVAEVAAGILEGQFTSMGKQHTVFLQNLEPRTHYYVSCVARHSLATITQVDLFTTASAASPLRVRSIESVAPESRLPTFRITFDGSVKLGSDPAIWVACGGLTQRFELSEEMIEGAKHDQLRVSLRGEERLPAGATCSLGFVSLEAVQRLHGEDAWALLDAKPMPDNAERFEFTVSMDAMEPALTTLLVAELQEEEVLLATLTEPVTSLEPFTYELRCSQRGEATVHRVFDSATTPLVMRSGFEARKGYVDLLVHTGLLPHLHDCELRLPATVGDAVQNPMMCERDGANCVVSFVSRVASPDSRSVWEKRGVEMTLELKSVTPVDGAERVAVNAPIVMTFNREAVAVKPVTVRCLDCVRPIVSLTPVCSGMQCVAENPEAWEADTTYYVTYDASTFRAAWESFFLEVPERFTSFTTAASACSMEFIAEEWDTSCSCVNTGSHCQCNCGATAILRAF